MENTDGISATLLVIFSSDLKMRDEYEKQTTVGTENAATIEKSARFVLERNSDQRRIFSESPIGVETTVGTITARMLDTTTISP